MGRMAEQPRLFQVICEVRYNPTLLYDDLHTQNGIVKRMRELGLPVSQKNPDGTLVCVDPKSKVLLTVGNQLCALSINEPNNLSSFLSRCSKYIPEVMSKLDVDFGVRIGVRAQWLMQYDSEDDASEQLRKTALSQSFSNMFSNIKSPGVFFTLPFDEKTQMNVSVRVETHRILEIANNITHRDETVSGVVIDLDIYDQVSQTRPEQINGFVKNVDGKFESVRNTVLKSLG
jgi:hypothetical protein